MIIRDPSPTPAIRGRRKPRSGASPPGLGRGTAIRRESFRLRRAVPRDFGPLRRPRRLRRTLRPGGRAPPRPEFQDSVRVGSAFEGGIAFRIGRSITLDAGYEQMAVYPHWVFWEAAGSGLVHGIALGIADGVSRQVAKKAPRAAPVVSFLLRNGISYAIHHQRRYEVNWPFGGDPGLIYEGYKVSLTFTY